MVLLALWARRLLLRFHAAWRAAVLQRWCCGKTEIYGHLARKGSEVLCGIHAKANNLCPSVYAVASSQKIIERSAAPPCCFGARNLVIVRVQAQVVQDLPLHLAAIGWFCG